MPRLAELPDYKGLSIALFYMQNNNSSNRVVTASLKLDPAWENNKKKNKQLQMTTAKYEFLFQPFILKAIIC